MDQRDAATQRGPREAAGPAGPRQEYLDAFDGASDDGGRGHEAHAPRPASEPGPPPRPGGRSAAPAGRHRAGPPRRSRAGVAAGWGRGRTLTGLAAAAVVTVLAVVIAGQVAEDDGAGEGRAGAAGPQAGGEPGAHGADDAFGERPHGERDGEPAQRPGGSAEEGEPDYEQLMDETFPLDPDLTASGELVPVAGSDDAVDPQAATVLRYRVDVEEGLDWDAEVFAEAVHRTLSDPRSWGNQGERSFARVSSGDHDFVVTLASPGTTADWCARSGLDTTEDNVSCNSSSTERVMINAWRWAQGSETYGDDIHGYRQMLINHEVGHRLGYGHVVCPAEGALAPVMMQQTKFLTTDGVTCEPNSWPHPGN